MLGKVLALWDYKLVKTLFNETHLVLELSDALRAERRVPGEQIFAVLPRMLVLIV